MRPPSAYAMGLIYWWARLAKYAPGLVNFGAHAPVLSNVAKRAAGLAPQREIPAFAPYTFKEWFRQRPVHNEGRPQVILWPDTFNNHFHPQTAQAAVEVLEAAGFQVTVPRQSLCCGRPLYDYGMLDLAERLLPRTLDALRPQIQAGIPVVGLEPSCTAVFRDELTNILPDDQDARRLHQQTFLLSEFLEKKGRDMTNESKATQDAPQPLKDGRGATDPGPRNVALDRLNPDILTPPETDHGTVPNLWFSFSAAHNRLEEGGWAREVTVRELPIATTIAGVNMRLTPGGVRELHWHKQSEWAYLLDGRARVTAVDPEGRNFVDDVGVGDLWFFPPGIPHSIQGLAEGCEFLLVFDNGAFSENSTFLLTDWFAHTPRDVLAKNFGVPIENTGDTTLRYLELFKSDHYAGMSLNQWLALTPPELVRAHLRLDQRVMDALHKEKPLIVSGHGP